MNNKTNKTMILLGVTMAAVALNIFPAGAGIFAPGGGGASTGQIQSQIDASNLSTTNGGVKITGNLNLLYTNGITMNGVIFESFDITNDNLFIGQSAGGIFNYQNAMGAPPVGGGIQPFNPSFTSGQDNLGIGFGAGQDIGIGRENYFIGIEAAWQVHVGSFNVVMGSTSMSNGNQSSSNNVVIGDESGIFSDAQGTILIGAFCQGNDIGSYTNIVIGTSAANNWNGNEKFNIIIGDNPGVAGEIQTIHIGTDGEQTNTFIAGQIHGNGSGLTNITANSPTIIKTNLSLATVGVNTWGRPIQICSFSVNLAEAGVVGVSGIQLEVPGQITNRISSITSIAGTIVGSDTNALPGAFVPVGGTWNIRDISQGAGNSSSIGNGGQQIIVY